MSIVSEPDVILDRMPATTNSVAKRPLRAIVLRVGSYDLAYIWENSETPLTFDCLYNLDPNHLTACPSEW